MKNKTTTGILSMAMIVIAIFIFFDIFPKKTTDKKSIDKIQITTSFYPLYFFTSQIVGDRAIVYNITPSGAEPHDYEPTTKDFAHIEDSQLLILNGNKFEAWGEKMIDSLRDTHTNVITVGENIANQTGLKDDDILRDPHVWLNPHLAEKEVILITEALKRIDPINAAFYETNTIILQDKFNELDKNFHDGLHNCLKKDIITSHAAFGHLAYEYTLNQVSISGLSPDEEPSLQELAKAADFAKNNNIKYIFFESLVSPKLSQTIADEIRAKTLILNPIEGLSDSEIAQGKNYFTEMENNLINLKIALECQ